jgi:hypothetical protein
MKNIIAGVAVTLLMWSTVPHAQEPPTSAETMPPVANATPPTDAGLTDLASMTFGCPKAALNAAAREAAKVRTQGTYQFSYFKILNDSHHASYEVHFTSNFNGEKPLRYCVAIYCQQGWDPRTSKTTVTLMGAAAQKTCHH